MSVHRSNAGAHKTPALNIAGAFRLAMTGFCWSRLIPDCPAIVQSLIPNQRQLAFCPTPRILRP
jgi:hypothetical protein